ncbi:single-stranded DNA-binding protein [Bacillus sp. FJAT-27445]|uniref:single-stranded DNA-binding protein n=1 Tax=Bacillus sp. FJAT-27445 TaxID=1679166 RepID=UPI0009EA657F|nr:single-stranded DNA-binding protein [Bacillus sp. FJAT-27445]
MINQVTLVGRLTKDPELKVTSEGTSVSNVILAVNRQYKNSNGEIDTDFVQCTLWKKAAENTVHYCRKGSVVGITGRIHTRHYDNQEGKRVYVTEVVAESIRFLSSKPAGAASHETENTRSVPVPGMDVHQNNEPSTESIPFRHQEQPVGQGQFQRAQPEPTTGQEQFHRPQPEPDSRQGHFHPPLRETAPASGSFHDSQPVSPPPFTFEREPSARGKEEFPFG